MRTKEERKLRRNPMPAIREELGGDFYYRCPWKDCGRIVRSEYVACPWCGAMLCFPYSDYEKE